ncbi:DrmB family protein [Terrisporobacter vanillatitrophus]|uniref:DrmB family protein n=1 Tax=Terrisporobacter vanillatitrophus TaxID=3058402 RepID=UPI003367323C
MDVKKRIGLNERSHSLRINQVTSVFGPGAMVDFIDQTLMVASPNYWRNYTTINDERLQKSLQVRELRMPPTTETGAAIPLVRFPQWYFCPKCRKFKSINEWEQRYKDAKKGEEMKTPRCLNCNKKLVPAGIITICKNGHINDFPWVEWVHIKNQSGERSVCSSPDIEIKTSSSGLGLEGIRVSCKNCGATTTMKGAFGGSNNDDNKSNNPFEKIELIHKDDESKREKIREMFMCKGYTYWSGKKEKCGEYPITVQRGALNVYFPKVESSIIIPPYSDSVNCIIEKSREYVYFMESYSKAIKRNKLQKFIEDEFEYLVEDISKDTNIDINIVREILSRKININDEEEVITKNKYRLDEYEALKGNISEEAKNTNDFKIEEQNIEEYNCNNLSKVVLVKKLREVRALVGFSRVNPPDNNIFGDIEDGLAGQSKLVTIKGEDNFYPAYESRGEGIFIELDDCKINEWINNNLEIEKRANIINSRYNEEVRRRQGIERYISPKFILLHTLAHLLIRELSFECGYSTASLCERIYCDNSQGEKPMSGILIYTSSGDSEGTLGGLVRQGKADTLPKIINSALERARWCSNDPVCIESKGQGRNSLNLAACHSCILLPETSCEEFNLLLDRAILIGDLDDRSIGFFSEY